MIFIHSDEVHCSGVVVCRPKQAAPPRRNYETAPFSKKYIFFKILFHARFKNGLGFKQNKVVWLRSSFKDSKKKNKGRMKRGGNRTHYLFLRSGSALLWFTLPSQVRIRPRLNLFLCISPEPDSVCSFLFFVFDFDFELVWTEFEIKDVVGNGFYNTCSWDYVLNLENEFECSWGFMIFC